MTVETDPPADSPSQGGEASGEGETEQPSRIEDELNTSLSDMLNLLAQEVERLKVSLEFYRRSEADNAQDLVRWHIAQIDQRQDRMDELKDMILASGETSLH